MPSEKRQSQNISYYMITFTNILEVTSLWKLRTDKLLQKVKGER